MAEIDVKEVLSKIDTMQKEGATAAEVGAFAKSTGYDLQALSGAFKTYKSTGEVDMAGAGTSMLQGLTFGLSEEIGGIAAELTGGDYDEYVTRQRRKMKLYQQQNPIVAAAWEVVGSLPTMVIPVASVAGSVAKATSGASRIATAARGAAGAAVEGAAYGFGTGEGLEGSVTNALSTGAVSGLVGGIAAPLTRLQQSTKMAGNMPIEQKAASELSKRLGPETLETFASPAMQQQAGMAMADTGDEAARYLRGIRTADSQVSELVDEAIDSRWKDQYQRVTGLINEGFDNDPQLVKALSSDLADMKDAAGLAYSKLYTDFVDLKDPSIGSLIRNESLISKNWDEAIKYAKKEARQDPVKLKALNSLPKADDIVDDTPLPIEVLDTVKKYLDDEIRTARKATDNTAASRQRALLATKKEFLEYVDAATNDGYAKVRNNFAEPAKMEEALELGRDAFNRKVSADEIRGVLQSMNPQESKAYVAGVLQRIYSDINNTGFNSDVLKKLIGTPEMTAKLKALMPNEQAWKRFQGAMTNEARQLRTKNLVIGGSNTAEKLADVSNAESLLDDAVSLAFDPTLATVNAGLMKRVTDFGQKMARRIYGNAETRSLQAKMLLETNPAKKAEIAQQINKARQELAQRTQASADVGATVGANVGSRVGLAVDEPEDSPLMIQVTKGQ